MAKISLKDVCKNYESDNGHASPALVNLNLVIEDREFVTLSGPRGSGKSTLLRIIAGLEESSSGDIAIAGKLMDRRSLTNQDVAMVFKEDSLLPNISVYDNIAIGLGLRNYPKAEIDKRVKEAAGIVGIVPLLRSNPRMLAPEEKQRVAIGRAIARKPNLLLFDEPLFSLDDSSRVRLRAEIVNLHRRLQSTTIYAASDHIEAMSMPDRLAVMNSGTIEQFDKPLTVYNEPKNIFVAGVLGRPPMNFIRGKLKEGAAGSLVFFESGDGVFEVALHDRPEAKLYCGREVILGVRPGAMELAEGPERVKGSRIQALVDSVEATGTETTFYLQTGAHSIVCSSRKSAGSSDAGHRLRFDVDAAKILLFDPQSKDRIV